MRIILGKGIQPTVRNDIIRVKDAYLEHLCNSLLFELKLNRLTVIVHGGDEKENVLEDCDGFFHRDNGSFKIHLIPSADCKKELFIHTLTHEFAHFLFCQCTDFNGINCDDGFVFLTAIQRAFGVESDRFVSDEHHEFGPRSFTEQDGIEEFCANAISQYIMVKLGYPEDWWRTAWKEEDRDYGTHLSYIHNLANLFGKPLMDCEYIDEVTCDEDVQGTVSNYFWYYIVTFQMKTLSDWIDRQLGPGTYMHLELAFDLLVFEDNCKSQARDDIQSILARLAQIPRYRVSIEAPYAYEYMEARYQARLKSRLPHLGRMIMVFECTGIRHPVFGSGTIMGIDEEMNATVCFGEKETQLSLEDIVMNCEFTASREGGRIIAFCELDVVRNLEKKLKEAQEKRKRLAGS